jgi:hypothetical protein
MIIVEKEIDQLLDALAIYAPSHLPEGKWIEDAKA